MLWVWFGIVSPTVPTAALQLQAVLRGVDLVIQLLQPGPEVGRIRSILL